MSHIQAENARYETSHFITQQNLNASEKFWLIEVFSGELPIQNTETFGIRGVRRDSLESASRIVKSAGIL